MATSMSLTSVETGDDYTQKIITDLSLCLSLKTYTGQQQDYYQLLMLLWTGVNMGTLKQLVG